MGHSGRAASSLCSLCLPCTWDLKAVGGSQAAAPHSQASVPLHEASPIRHTVY